VTGIGTGVWAGIPADFRLSFPIPLVNVLYQAFPLVERCWFFYKHKRVLDAVGERLLQPVAECMVSPVDLARLHIEVNKEIGKLLVGPHTEPVEFCFRSGFCVRISKHLAELFNKAWPIVQPTRRDDIDFIFIFELCVEVVLGRPVQVG
jgi:hypothetical protein